MRNSNCIAIAPTATISNIVGVSACIEPTYQNVYVKSNLSGEFTVVNEYMVRDLKSLGLWDEVMVSDLKYFDGTLARIDRIPTELRRLYATAFETDPSWLVECASRRQKWIDQSQSLNIYVANASGKKLDETYKLAWLRGLKTTYYLRTMGATHAEKSTVKAGALNAVSADVVEAAPPKFCAIDDPECESCQ
jgi:ribonucleoside-diphosphate reductase alpha chain